MSKTISVELCKTKATSIRYINGEVTNPIKFIVIYFQKGKLPTRENCTSGQ